MAVTKPKIKAVKPKVKRLSIYQKLSAPLDANENRYQACIDRLNEVCGVEGWGFNTKVVKERMVKLNGSSHKAYEICMAVSIWIGVKENQRAATGGAIAGVYYEGVDEAVRKAMLKAAAIWGIGKACTEQSQLSLIDDEAVEDPIEKPQTPPSAHVEIEPSTDILKRYSNKAIEKTAAQKMAEEDGAPPSGFKSQPDPNQPRHPDPSGEITEPQKMAIATMSKQLGVNEEKFKSFLSQAPTQAQAADVISHLKKKLKFKTAFAKGAQ